MRQVMIWPAQDPRAAERHVYFIEAEGTGLVKIGVGNCAYARLKSLDQMSAVPLRLLGSVKTDKLGALEKGLHSRFAAHRARGEWFRADTELMAFIAEAATMPRKPRAPLFGQRGPTG